MTDNEFSLTDDEVLALGARRSVRWPGGTPTLDAADEAAFDRAVFRGERSLYVRDLLDSEDLGHLVEVVTGSPGQLALYLGTEDLRRASWALSTFHYAGEKDMVFESVSEVGVHRLRTYSDSEHEEYLLAMLTAAFRSGPDVSEHEADTGTDIAHLCVLALGSDIATLVSARRGEVVGGSAALGDAGPAFATEPASLEPEDAVSLLMNSIRPVIAASSTT